MNLFRNLTAHENILFAHSNPSVPSSRTARKTKSRKTIFFSLAQQPNAGHGRLILDVSTSHTMTHHSQYDSSGREMGPSQRQHTTLTTNIHAPGRIRTRGPRKRVARDPRLRQLGHWNRKNENIFPINYHFLNFS